MLEGCNNSPLAVVHVHPRHTRAALLRLCQWRFSTIRRLRTSFSFLGYTRSEPSFTFSTLDATHFARGTVGGPHRAIVCKQSVVTASRRND